MNNPMICGGIYEFVEQNKTVRQGTLVSVTTDMHGVQCGVVHWAGYKPEMVNQNSERWSHLKLIGRPAAPNVGRPKKKG